MVISGGINAACEAPPALVRELTRLETAINHLGSTVEDLRNVLDIQDEPAQCAPESAKSVAMGSKVDVRAKDFYNQIERLNNLINRLQPVLAAVKEI